MRTAALAETRMINSYNILMVFIQRLNISGARPLEIRLFLDACLILHVIFSASLIL